MDSSVKKALRLGILCSVSYLAVYVVRNMLGVVAPQMIESGRFSESYIGAISTGYMIAYACGQLINGAVGDKVIARYMISGGLVGAGICNLLLPYAPNLLMNTVIYSLSGFFLSMIYGPMTKVVSENVRPEHAARCALGYTVASFLGSPVAGIIAMLLQWQQAFLACGGILIAMGTVCFCLFLRFEKTGVVVYRAAKKEKQAKNAGVRTLLRHSIIKYTFVAVLTGIVRTTVVFWIPTYLAQYLEISNNLAVGIFSGVTFAMALAPILNILLAYERVFKRNRNKTLLFMFSLSCLSFLVLFLWKDPVANVVFLMLALLGNAGASSLLWSVYCPSLAKTGMVSTATGLLDFMSYMGAAVANLVFSNAVSVIGWSWLILCWCGLMGAGVLVALKKDNVN